MILTTAGLVVILAGLRVAEAIVTPFLLALFVTALSAPLFFWLRHRRLPEVLSLLVVLLVIVAIAVVMSLLVGNSVEGFSRNLPLYQERLQDLSQQVMGSLDRFGIALEARQLQNLVDLSATMGFVGKSFNRVLATLANGLFIVLLVGFMLVELDVIADKIRNIDRDASRTLAQLEESSRSILRYFMIKTLVSLATGVLVTLGLLAIGVDYPVLWGLVAFLLNFIPNIGSILAAVPPLLLALVQLGGWEALWVLVLYLAVNNLVGNLLEPRLMGQQLGLSPLVVFLSLVFWGWLLGPVGMFLSVPLTMTLKIVLEHREGTRWLAVLLGGQVPAPVQEPGPP